ncbi:hypothetical protein AX16_010995 [Volvariella volvacea WC 439]|nr:hypothetical protein AX16_010995 [Volvariella volvacea WC 439]
MEPNYTGNLPLDILERIATLLRDDNQTLLNLTQSSKAVYLRTRYLAFRSIRINQRNAPKFLELLQHPVSCIPWSVRQLSISGNSIADELGQVIISQQSLNEPSWISKSINQLAPLTRVESLMVRDLIWKLLGREAREALFAQFKEVTRLRLDGILFQRFEDLVTCLGAFSNLRELRLTSIVWFNKSASDLSGDGSGEVRESVKMLDWCLPSLDVLSATPTLLWDVLVHLYGKRSPPSSSLSIRALVSPLLFNSELGVLNNILAALGPSLEHLALNLQRLVVWRISLISSLSIDNAPLLCRKLIIKHEPSNRVLGFALFPQQALLRLAPTGTGTHLISKMATITLSYPLPPDPTTFQNFPWEAMDTVLTNCPQFKNLHSVVFEAPGAGEWDAVKTGLRGCFEKELMDIRRLEESDWQTE